MIAAIGATALRPRSTTLSSWAAARLGSRPRLPRRSKGPKVAVIGAGTIGGTCVNVGCVPSKALIRAVESIHHANAAPMRFNGVEAGARMADWGKVIAEKDSLVSGLRQAKYADLLPLYNNIAYHEGSGAARRKWRRGRWKAVHR